jgi:hypothetical protein
MLLRLLAGSRSICWAIGACRWSACAEHCWLLLALHLLLESSDDSLPSLLEAAATRGSSGRVLCCEAVRSWLWCALWLLGELLVLVVVGLLAGSAGLPTAMLTS